MLEFVPMIGLALVLVIAIGSLGVWVLTHRGRPSTDQRPPEQPTREWLKREAENGKKFQASRRAP